jgi:DNA-binding NtrC family response regulator
MQLIKHKTYNPSILIVDDELHVVTAIKEILETWGYSILTAFSGYEALDVLEHREVDMVLSDQAMPGMNGLELLDQMKERFPDIPFVMITGQGSIDKAVIAMRSGAVDYLLKPCRDDELREVIDRSVRHAGPTIERREIKKYLSSFSGFENILTQSKRMLQAIELAAKVASIPNAPVIIYGESGAGKELLAMGIHHAGGCPENAFVAVNCSGIPAGLMESELFGHVKGAFTGAEFTRVGKFEMARNGTLLLDEIGDMPIDIQPKLLRVLEESRYESVGSNRLIRVNTRVIAATHHHLEKLIVYGKFRRDLFHRINRFPIFLPPLRERREDILLLANHFLENFAQEVGKPTPELSKTAMRILENHDWPGNIRELKNMLERAAIVAEDGVIGLSHLGIEDNCPKISDDDHIHLDISIPAGEFSLNAATKKIKKMILDQCGGNKSRAAELLKINRKQFYND